MDQMFEEPKQRQRQKSASASGGIDPNGSNQLAASASEYPKDKNNLGIYLAAMVTGGILGSIMNPTNQVLGAVAGAIITLIVIKLLKII